MLCPEAMSKRDRKCRPSSDAKPTVSATRLPVQPGDAGVETIPTVHSGQEKDTVFSFI